jgi:hypothetical protein
MVSLVYFVQVLVTLPDFLHHVCGHLNLSGINFRELFLLFDNEASLSTQCLVTECR